ncbi:MULTISPECIES: chemotaxis protein CheB [Pseudomonas]|uniref:protein-glutamate methylesterase n=2 Tax=Pseudomonas TaxID=286 RepID=A0A5E7URZ7_PSEFL|nr:chemotaxis protein CheB [Pseudomonas fluorescens]VVQ10344.1 Chemotaxis response regulator protein-glutamate methylesterase [Pseudomonas fluorescens]
MESNRDIIVIGGSEGSLDPLREILAGLPGDFPAAILIVVHTGSSSPRLLASMLNLKSTLPVTYGEEGNSIELGHVYLAPPDKHLEVIKPGIIHLSDGPKVNFSRPAADRLFETAATAFGGRVISLILSGNDGDGAAGANAVRLAGGLSLVQDPGDAVVPSMPIQAIENDHPDCLVRSKSLVEVLMHAVTPFLSPE